MENKNRLKVTHKIITMFVFEKMFKYGQNKSDIVENPLWEGAYLIHSYIDNNNRELHLFFHDPVYGTELQECQDILTIEPVYTTFRSLDTIDKHAVKEGVHKVIDSWNLPIFDKNLLEEDILKELRLI